MEMARCFWTKPGLVPMLVQGYFILFLFCEKSGRSKDTQYALVS